MYSFLNQMDVWFETSHLWSMIITGIVGGFFALGFVYLIVMAYKNYKELTKKIDDYEKEMDNEEGE